MTNHSSVIELNRNALANNFKFIKNLIGEKVTLSSVIKGNAYGHGIQQMVPELQYLGVNHFSVFSSFEAKIAHESLTQAATIMVMGDIAEEDISWVVENKIQFFIYNISGLQTLLREAKKQTKKIHVHIELETGMNRHGFEQNQLLELVEIIEENKNLIEVEGICTHFAGAESSANFKRIQEQQQSFLKGIEFLKIKGIEAKKLHTSCSAGIIAYPQFNLDMVRIGIIQYGLWPSKESQLTYNVKHEYETQLESVLSWRSSIIDIKNVKAGDFVGYGTSFLAETNMKIASVPVGYGYGFSRSLSNTGRVLVNGKRLSVIGTVNMNMFLIDVTNIEVKIGDTVTIIGQDGEQSINVSYFGNLSEQLNYELLTRLDKSIPRVVV
ncbi:MAG: alanine racemase [Mesonia sp.]|nr:alanine racemase [Mesonia sp.]MAQ41000.1 alanine racemase [Mesonia sp.]MBJ96460.1 alanine racemase [Flavobacteriaceae bacterium]